VLWHAFTFNGGADGSYGRVEQTSPIAVMLLKDLHCTTVERYFIGRV